MMQSEQEKKDMNKDGSSASTVTIRHYLIVFIVICIVFAAVSLHIAEPQYAYYAIQKQQNITSTLSNSRQSLCETNKSAPRFKQQQYIQSETAKWHAYCHLASSLPALIMALLVGSWSDKMGRKFALWIPTAGFLFKAAFMSIAMKMEWNIYIFIIPFVVEGLCGTYISLITVAYSFAADLTKLGKSRTFGIVLIEITLGIGITIGNIGSGYMIKHIGFLNGAILVSGMAIFSGILIFFLPESIESSQKQNFSSISQKQYIRNAIDFYTKKGPLRWKFLLLAIVFAFSALPNIGRVNVQTLYVMNSPFCWNSVLIGWFGSSRSFIQMVVGLGLSRLLLKYMSERTLCIAGTISAILYYLLQTFAINDIMIFLTPVVGLLGNYPMTMIRAMLSGLTPKEKQGAMFGGLAAVDAVCSLLGSVFANFIYSETVSIYRGLIMLVFVSQHLIALCLLGFLIFWESNKKEKIKMEKVKEEKTADVKLIYVVKL